jgi:3-phosphoshikimate 1-carboxyvinyltransferase
MKEIEPKSSVHGCVRIPGSKSITHRALIAAALARGESLLCNPLSCEDTGYTINGLRELGIKVFADGNHVKVCGEAGQFPVVSGRRQIYLGNAGTSYRLLLSTAALARGNYILTGNSRMRERPVGELVEALNQVGADTLCIVQKGFPPVLVRSRGIQGGEVKFKGSKSSQYVSSLLMAGPYAEKDIEIEITGELVSKPYLDLTLDVMKTFGAEVEREGYRYFRIRSGHLYQACRFSVEGDVSSASYFWAAAAITRGSISTENIHPYTTGQGDIGFLNLLEAMGCRVERGTDRVTVYGGILSGIEAEMSSMPDMVPTLAAVALFAKGKTIIRNVPHLRHKESDRLKSIAIGWTLLGASVDELPDGLIIHGGDLLAGKALDPFGDHRIAMSLAVIGLMVPGLKIMNETCVNKSFPQFWDVWDRI